jgi:hypothetical protein
MSLQPSSATHTKQSVGKFYIMCNGQTLILYECQQYLLPPALSSGHNTLTDGHGWLLHNHRHVNTQLLTCHYTAVISAIESLICIGSNPSDVKYQTHMKYT